MDALDHQVTLPVRHVTHVTLRQTVADGALRIVAHPLAHASCRATWALGAAAHTPVDIY